MADEMSYFSISLQPCSCITADFVMALLRTKSGFSYCKSLTKRTDRP